MKNRKLIVVLIGTFMLNTIFWQESLGINISVTLLFILGSNFNETKKLLQSKFGVLAILFALISCSMVIIHNSTISIIASVVSLVTLIGFLHFPRIRTSYGALLSGLIDSIKLPELFERKSTVVSANYAKKIRIIRLILIPIVVFIVFFSIFYGANLVFRTAVDDFFSGIGNFFDFIFMRFSFFRILFVILCFFLSSWIVYKGVHHFFEKHDSQQIDRLIRLKRKPWNLGAISAGKSPKYGDIKTLSLKNENVSSFIMIISICVLLFVINCIDIVTVWFGYSNQVDINFSEEVHEGVNYLIVSILLSIAIMLYVFRGNQNFFKGKKRLIIWSNIWILQNVILIISVIIRNYYYIANHGLTHKRIGVFIFLTIVVLGLLSLYIKINKSKSFYFMSKFNSWTIYAVLIAMSYVNWDFLIVRYNLQHRNSIELDPYYVCSLSDETVLYLWKSKSELKEWRLYMEYCG